MRNILISVVLLLSAGVLAAEISPDSYRLMQESSPEKLIIEVLRVKTPWISLSRTKPVTVGAKIVRVQYSETRLSEGDEITITYEHFKPKAGWVGPRPIPILSEDTQYPAFLQYDAESISYTPAARGYSFEFLSIEDMF